MIVPDHSTAGRRLGRGLRWHPQLDVASCARASVDFIEVAAHDVSARRLPSAVALARERGVQVLPHESRLSLGSGKRPARGLLRRLAAAAERLDAPLVGELIAFVRADGLQSPLPLPVAQTRAALEILVENVTFAQSIVGVPLALENVGALVEWPHPQMDEPAFISELVRRSGALLLLDLSNLHTNAARHGHDALHALERLPLDRIAYARVRAVPDHGAFGTRLAPAVLALVEELFARVEVPGLLLDSRRPDGDASGPAALRKTIDAAAQRGVARRGR